MRTYIYIFGIVFLGASLLFLATPVAHGDTGFQFAPPKDQSSVGVDTSTQIELSTIQKWETKIENAIPKNVTVHLGQWDAIRIENAQKYAVLRDESKKSVSITKGKDSQSAPNTFTETYYYWYSLLAFFFGHAYVFYGVILLAVLFVTRFILYRLNFIA